MLPPLYSYCIYNILSILSSSFGFSLFISQFAVPILSPLCFGGANRNRNSLSEEKVQIHIESICKLLVAEYENLFKEYIALDIARNTAPTFFKKKLLCNEATQCLEVATNSPHRDIFSTSYHDGEVMVWDNKVTSSLSRSFIFCLFVCWLVCLFACLLFNRNMH